MLSVLEVGRIEGVSPKAVVTLARYTLTPFPTLGIISSDKGYYLRTLELGLNAR